MEVLKQGDLVVANGLLDTVDLNGMQGTLVGWTKDGERAIVEYGDGERFVTKENLSVVKTKMRHLPSITCALSISAACVYYIALNKALLKLKKGDGVVVSRLIQLSNKIMIVKGSFGIVSRVPGGKPSTIGVTVNGTYFDATSADVVPSHDPMNPLAEPSWRQESPSIASPAPVIEPNRSKKRSSNQPAQKKSWFCCFSPNSAVDDEGDRSPRSPPAQHSTNFNEASRTLPRITTSSVSSSQNPHPPSVMSYNSIKSPPQRPLAGPIKSPDKPLAKSPPTQPIECVVKSPPKALDSVRSTRSVSGEQFANSSTRSLSLIPVAQVSLKSAPKSPHSPHSRSSVGWGHSPTSPLSAGNEGFKLEDDEEEEKKDDKEEDEKREAGKEDEEEETGMERRRTLPVGSLVMEKPLGIDDIEKLYGLMIGKGKVLTHSGAVLACTKGVVLEELHVLKVVRDPGDPVFTEQDTERFLSALPKDSQGISQHVVMPTDLHLAVLVSTHAPLAVPSSSSSSSNELPDVEEVEVSTETTQQPKKSRKEKKSKKKKRKEKKAKKNKRGKKEKKQVEKSSDDADAVDVMSTGSSLKPCEVFSSPEFVKNDDEVEATPMVPLPPASWDAKTVSPEKVSPPPSLVKSPEKPSPKLVLNASIAKAEGEPLGLDITDDLVVTSVVQNGAAQRSGLDFRCVGMQLFKVNGEDVTEAEEAAKSVFSSVLELQFCLPRDAPNPGSPVDMMSSPQVAAPPCTPTSPAAVCVPCDPTSRFVSPVAKRSRSRSPVYRKNEGLMGQNRIRWVRSPIQADALWIESLRTRAGL